jgi:hypothetical protein
MAVIAINKVDSGIVIEGILKMTGGMLSPSKTVTLYEPEAFRGTMKEQGLSFPVESVVQVPLKDNEALPNFALML